MRRSGGSGGEDRSYLKVHDDLRHRKEEEGEWGDFVGAVKQIQDENDTDDEIDTDLLSYTTRLIHDKKQREIEHRSYQVTFERGPIGLELEADWYGMHVTVKGFQKVDGKDGLAKMSKVVCVGDVIHAINDETCLDMTFDETLEKLRQVSKSMHTLHFTSLSGLNEMKSFRHDKDISLAKQYIQKHKTKFYRSLRKPGHEGLLYGCIERHCGEEVIALHFHREDTGEFLLACSVQSDYLGPFLFHTLQDSHHREWKDLPQQEDNAAYIGQMLPTFLGTEFRILDHNTAQEHEIGFLIYDTNVLGRIPNSLTLVLGREEDIAAKYFNRPSISERFKLRQSNRIYSPSATIFERIRSWSHDLESLVDNLTSPTHSLATRKMPVTPTRAPEKLVKTTEYGALEQDEHGDLLYFETKKPSWSEELNAWTLNFQGRVTSASKKNFLLCSQVGNEAMEEEFGADMIALRFGKISKARFTLDFQAPLSPMLALAIAASTFAKKRVVTS
ncbi:ATP-binding Cassette (ABC) superfamily [Thraustotheca clavata]|uniref:ATP-binding Cassette (ABC) superfamily n=1 Tax=Thraustotheca clavata TaxID=74557 RepID=A0A1V9YXY2_9STRA|nr:ATP-binding Cassette (ABC) superfamily [Thraustotheca clavata]